jgi:hypothetical protein
MRGGLDRTSALSEDNVGFNLATTFRGCDYFSGKATPRVAYIHGNVCATREFMEQL